MSKPTPLGIEQVDRLTTNTEPWLSCDDCFEQVDQVVEGVLHHPGKLPEPFWTHLTACAVCHEEARSLAALIAPDFGFSADEGVSRLDRAIADNDA